MNAETIPLEQYLKEKAELEKKITQLEEMVEWFKRQVFGKRSEKVVQDSPDQFTLFELPETPEPEKAIIESHERIKRPKEDAKKISFSEDIPVERTVLDLSENEKVCKETGKPLVKIGEEVTQKLAHKPGSYFIKEIIRPKYAVRNTNEETIVCADLPDSIIPKCKADESLLAEILVKKFVDHLPLYRQSEIFAREGIYISRQVLSNWVVKCGQALKPLYDRLTKVVLETQNVFIDEVPVNMLKPGKGKTQRTFMWVMVGGKDANPSLRIYNFRDNRRHENAEQILNNFENGIVHSDKYGAYEALANKKKFTWCPCWVHIRRKFFDAEGGDNEFVKLILRKIKYLFMFERIAWSRSPEERIQIRLEKEIPIIDELIELVKDKMINGKILARSKFKEALGYFMGLIPHLKNYTLHPSARLDNNVAERAVRPIALGRKNWLFFGSEDSGESAAVILSLVQTCKALGINSREYLEDVMRRILSHNIQDLDDLLPHKWVKQS